MNLRTKWIFQINKQNQIHQKSKKENKKPNPKQIQKNQKPNTETNEKTFPNQQHQIKLLTGASFFDCFVGIFFFFVWIFPLLFFFNQHGGIIARTNQKRNFIVKIVQFTTQSNRYIKTHRCMHDGEWNIHNTQTHTHDSTTIVHAHKQPTVFHRKTWIRLATLCFFFFYFPPFFFFFLFFFLPRQQYAWLMIEQNTQTRLGTGFDGDTNQLLQQVLRILHSQHREIGALEWRSTFFSSQVTHQSMWFVVVSFGTVQRWTFQGIERRYANHWNSIQIVRTEIRLARNTCVMGSSLLMIFLPKHLLKHGFRGSWGDAGSSFTIALLTKRHRSLIWFLECT